MSRTPEDTAEAILDQLIAAKGGTRREGQVKMARSTAKALSTGKPAMIQGGTGIGKALDIDTLIPTTEGWVRMGDLQAGVHHPFDPQTGKPCNITEVFDVLHGRDCYEVKFLGGGALIADAEHLWDTVSDYQARAAAKRGDEDPWSGAKTRTTQEIKDSLRVRNRHNHRIPVAAPPVLPKKRLPVDPYELGYWLGSTSRGYETQGKVPSSALPSPEAAKAFQHLSITKGGGDTHLIEPDDETTKKLSALGLLLSERFIPEQYMFASIEQRRELLIGLLDAAAIPRLAPRQLAAQVSLYKTQGRLVDDIGALAASLGFRPTLSDRNLRDVTLRLVTFTPTELLFRAPGKVAGAGSFEDPGRRLGNNRSIISIEPVESRPVRCIAVDSPGRLYMAGESFIPTHNSLAYLAGALASGAKTAVAPHTKALQDQLGEDLDLVIDAFKDVDFSADDAIFRSAPSYAIVKGRSAYFCGNRVAAGPTEDQDALPLDAEGESPSPTSALGEEVAALIEWAKTTETGDRADAPQVSYKAWSMVCGSADDCSANGCKKNPDLCFAERARMAAEDANIVVVNQAYLAAAMKIEFLELGVDAVVVDEAHELPLVVAGAFGAVLKRRRVEQTIKRATNSLVADQLMESDDAERTMKDADQKLGDLDGHMSRMKPYGADRGIVETAPVKKALEGLRNLLDPVRRKVRNSVDRAADEKEKGKRQSLLQTVVNLDDDLRLLIGGSDDYQVVWATKENGMPVLHAARFDVGATIHEQLIERIADGHIVLTSATLTVGGTFDHPAQQMGLTVDEETYPWSGEIVESPFDYQRQGMIWLPPDMPEPKNTDEGRAAYFEAVSNVALGVARAAGGRTLVLCTSKRAVDSVSQALRSELEPEGYTVLVQQTGEPPKAIAQQFVTTDKAVLVGTRTFWTGVSLPGDACVAVVVDKVPFPTPDDPIIAALTEKIDRNEGKGKGFTKVSLAEATLTIVQGVGRLIRTVNDRGVVVLCDPRVNPMTPYKRGYWRTIASSLPNFRRTMEPEPVFEFLREIDRTASGRGEVLEVEESAEHVEEVVDGPIAV